MVSADTVASDILRLYSRPRAVRELVDGLLRDAWDERFRTVRDDTGVPIIAQTHSFEYDCCYSYALVLNPEFEVSRDSGAALRMTDSQGVEFHSAAVSEALEVIISAISPYYAILHVTTRWPSGIARIGPRIESLLWDFQPRSRQRPIIEQLMWREGLQQLPEEILFRRVLGVRLELCDPDRVNVLRCLFCDGDVDEPVIEPPIVDVSAVC